MNWSTMTMSHIGTFGPVISASKRTWRVSCVTSISMPTSLMLWKVPLMLLCPHPFTEIYIHFLESNDKAAQFLDYCAEILPETLAAPAMCFSHHFVFKSIGLERNLSWCLLWHRIEKIKAKAREPPPSPPEEPKPFSVPDSLNTRLNGFNDSFRRKWFAV